MQESSEADADIFRGVEGITDELNRLVKGGPKFTRSAVYRLIADGRIPVFRLGAKRSQIYSTRRLLAGAFTGMPPSVGSNEAD